jgi:hypothetical protein
MMTPSERWSRLGALAALALLLLLAVPLFLCMPLVSDVTHYDLCAQNVLRGGVHYRDIGDFNLPGMVWIHVGIRSLLGWRPEALRAVDLAVVAAIVGLLVRWLGLMGVGPAARTWAAVLLFGFYFSMSEWVHCQRDTWMLLPALVSLELRRRQIERVQAGKSAGRTVLWAAAEGLCWGAAVWIKPFVIFPAFACWLGSIVWVCRTSPERRTALLAADAGGLVLGGLLAGLLGAAWLWGSGTWPYFLEVLFSVNRGYYRSMHSLSSLERLRHMVTFLCPWGLVYLLSLPLALLALLRRPPQAAPGTPESTAPVAALLLAALFLGWFFQVAFVQLHHDYVLAPAALLGTAVAAGVSLPGWWRRVRFLGLGFVVGLAIILHPLARPERLALWGRCWAEGSSPDLRNRLSITDWPWTPDWVALGQVEEYLRQEQVADREVMCFNTSTTPLYLGLGVQPPIPATHFDHVHFSPAAFEPLREALNASPERFVVSDLNCLCFRRSALPEPEEALDLPPEVPREWAERYPWCEPVVFRAGRYRVHRVTGPVKELRCSLESYPELMPKKAEPGP